MLAAACSGGASVSIASPEDGATVESPVSVSMEANGFSIEPAGSVREGAGHFHLMVDASCLAAGQVIPEDAEHLHFGDGATETEVDLPAGEHTLCLQAGDGAHTALPLTDRVTITVAGPPAAEEEEEPEEAAGTEEWTGTYVGTVTWDCGPIGPQQGTLDGAFTIGVDESGVATMEGSNTVTGSCQGPEEGTLTTPITVPGERTADGFEFPSSLWQVPGTFTITVDGDRGTGTMEGPAPDAVIHLDFDVQCESC